jgi:arylsulfatase A-like enzyme
MHADAEQKKNGSCRRGSKLGRKKSKPPHRLEGHTMFYLADRETHADNFHRRYRMNKDVFMEILHVVREYGDYLKLKDDVVGTASFSRSRNASLLAYGAPADS